MIWYHVVLSGGSRDDPFSVSGIMFKIVLFQGEMGMFNATASLIVPSHVAGDELSLQILDRFSSEYMTFTLHI